MATAKSSKRRSLANWLERRRPHRIGLAAWDELKAELAPLSESYLRKLLREFGTPLEPLVDGVRQGTFEELEASLLALLDEYKRGDAATKALCRRLVITAKDHARWAARKPGKAADKEEMALWMLTWLENPPLFPEWVKLRRAARRTAD